MSVPMRKRGFTLVEVMASIAIIAIIALLLASVTTSVGKTYSFTTRKIQKFRRAREAFDSITRRLSEATLNTYWDYDDPTKPTNYIRQSELRFISGNAKTLGLPASAYTHAVFFQAPIGFVNDTNYKNLPYLLNTWGFFVEYADDSAFRPPFVTAQMVPYLKRFRLMEMMEPSETLTLYQAEITAGGNSKYTGKDWFTTPLSPNKRVRAENIIALVILPKLSPADQVAGGYSDDRLAPTYLYDSTGTGMNTLADPNLNPKNQLPPVLQVAMVALDETAALRMSASDVTELQGVLGGRFADSKNFLKDLRRDAQTYPDGSQDPSLEAYLINKRYDYRIFTTNVSIKAAKWSRSQKN